jgi:hypothetical protein
VPDETIKVFVGGTDEHEIAFNVLAHSIYSRTTREVEVVRLDRVGITAPVPVNPKNRQVTTFSFARFFIPEALGFTGRGVYLDSDMVVLSDIGELWDTPFLENSLVQMCPGWQSAVMLIDGRVGWKIDELVARLDRGELGYKSLVNVVALGHASNSLDGRWNHTDHLEPDTKLLHYTAMDTQPWLFRGHPLGHVWETELRSAIAAGMVTRDELARSVQAGYVRPSLMAIVDEEPPYDDAAFIFPHRARRKAVAK